uniref:Transmembrane protein 154 n=1 Tax=Equus asinus asinus TaxID=83772 RepID=A0A8C4MHT7_EQUAS
TTSKLTELSLDPLLSFGTYAQGNAASKPYISSADMPLELERTDEEATILSTFAAVTTETLITNTSSTHTDEGVNQLEFILMVLIPLILLAVLFLSVIFLVTCYKRKRTKQEPSSQGSQSALQTCDWMGGEGFPIFEEDTPSVMEIEMEELDKWMNSMNRNADYEGLPTLKEEKESNHNPRYF